MSEKEKQEQIKVEDRRYFDRQGNPVESVEQEPEETAKATEEPPQLHSETEYIQPDFVSILFSFVHSALIHLGDVDDPIQQKRTENIEGARQMIDTLELLQTKTKGNLTPEEEHYLENALFDLRMRYMQKAKIIR